MKKRLMKVLALAGVLALGITGSAFAQALPEASEEAVTVTGSAPGIEGEPIVVEVVADAEQIYSVTVVEQNETPGIGSVACDTLPGEIVAQQNIDVESISGATVSSEAIKAAG